MRCDLGGLEPPRRPNWPPACWAAVSCRAELLSRLPSSTGGNPLFVRELVGMLVHDGVLVAGPDGWRLTIDVDAIAVPPTIQALLASRLERLNTADRRVLEIASVIGTDFSPAAVSRARRSGRTEVEGVPGPAAPARTRPAQRRRNRRRTGVAVPPRPDPRCRLPQAAQIRPCRVCIEHWRTGSRPAAPAGRSSPTKSMARHLESAHGYRVDLGQPGRHTAELALRSRGLLPLGGPARPGARRAGLGRYPGGPRRGTRRPPTRAAGRAVTGRLRGVPVGRRRRRRGATGRRARTHRRRGLGAVGDVLPMPVHRRTPIPRGCRRSTSGCRAPSTSSRRRGDPTGSAKAHRVRASARGRLGRIGDCESDLFEALIAARQARGPSSDHRLAGGGPERRAVGAESRRPKRAGGAWTWFGCSG